jgi:hypothetical protein
MKPVKAPLQSLSATNPQRLVFPFFRTMPVEGAFRPMSDGGWPFGTFRPSPQIRFIRWRTFDGKSERYHYRLALLN